MTQWSLRLDSAEQTRHLGQRLGRLLVGGDVVLLSGELGAGKTCLTQGLALGLGVPLDEPVSSPSYTLMNHHRGRLDLYHFDLYRLSEADELFEIGFDEYLHGAGVTVVEWFDRIADLKVEGLRIVLSYETEDSRRADFCANGFRSEQLIEQLQREYESA